MIKSERILVEVHHLISYWSMCSIICYFQEYRSYKDVGALSETILKIKHIDPSKDPEFTARLNTTFNPMCEINRLTNEAVKLKRTKYDVDNEEHEMLLLSLWNCLQPERELDSRISEMWGDIGFQGEDPATDFRGA